MEKMKDKLSWRSVAASFGPLIFLILLWFVAVLWRDSLFTIACAAFTTGAGGGFLFGVPKTVGTLEQDLPKRLEANTNLEQISDWLTKIIVGVGLVKARSLWSLFGEVSSSIASDLGVTESLACATLALSLFVGGLTSYLVTRLVLQGAISKADREASHGEFGAVNAGSLGVDDRVRSMGTTNSP